MFHLVFKDKTRRQTDVSVSRPANGTAAPQAKDRQITWAPRETKEGTVIYD
jgi:hypothetical protein